MQYLVGIKTNFIKQSSLVVYRRLFDKVSFYTNEILHFSMVLIR